MDIRDQVGLDLLRLDLLAGEPLWLKLPYAEEDEQDQLINAVADAIFEEYARRKTARHRRQQLDDWLRPVCYQLLARCYDYNLLLILSKRVARSGRRRSAAIEPSNPFQLPLFGIFASDKGLFDEKDRSRISMELWYAHRHFVPWCFVNGFVRQYGPISREKSVTHIERDCESFIIGHVGFELTELRRRGVYPRHIVKGARAMIDELGKGLERIREGVIEDLIDDLGDDEPTE